MDETARLATFAADLDYGAVPAPALQMAKDSLLDSLAVGLYGSSKPWSRIIVAFVDAQGARGSSTVLGERATAPAPLAALANGTMIHGFELDNVRQPGAGVHAGATVVPALLAVSEERHAGGRASLAALVAGCEVMFRIGLALGHGVEARGFHAPGLTGTFGAAVAAGKILGLGAREMTHALGIAGSLSSGLLEFSRARSGGMVKRLHMGRAAEGGVLAAHLAAGGFTGPESVLEGKLGFCQAYSSRPDLEKLTAGLGRDFETLNICIKRYPCHIYAHAPISALVALREAHRFDASEVEGIVVAGEEKLGTHHAIYEPKDVAAAQYSVPYAVALALFCDPADPESFSEENLCDPGILEMARRVEIRVDERIDAMKERRAAKVVVRLRGGRELEREEIFFKGTPQNPLTAAELRQKVERLAGRVLSPQGVGTLIERVQRLEEAQDMAAFLQPLLRARRES